ncbi:prostaglandin E synthase 3 isoform X2 [Gadus chalcogrammus]|uniref:prostaglandin E synthase 3 isoform X2 n=1 Tax=Gadus chalcogrammus TaxID=1042646 RepID=UPI0024C2AD5E|nr:prostaglandin E synthase 3 isoform X2 [Gadus chalcogrammus]
MHFMMQLNRTEQPRQWNRPAETLRQPATAKWYDRRDSVFIEFCVGDTKDLKVRFEQSSINFSCLGGPEKAKHQNVLDLYGDINHKESKHRRTDRSVLCCLKKAVAGRSWPRLSKDKGKVTWLSVDFNNWKDWDEDSDEDLSSFDKFSEMMNTMGGDGLPDLEGGDEEHGVADSGDGKMPDLE